MKLLLDTHVILWLFSASETLSDEVLDAIADGTSTVASVASLWEIAIKVAKGKLATPTDLPRLLIEAGIEILPVSISHAWAVRTAPAVMKTADPFDRLIYAQAKVEGLTLATRDDALLHSGLVVLKA